MLVGAEKLFEIIEDFRQITFIEPVRSILLHFRFGAERHAKTGRMNHRQIVRAVANRNGLRHIDAHPRAHARNDSSFVSFVTISPSTCPVSLPSAASKRFAIQ